MIDCKKCPILMGMMRDTNCIDRAFTIKRSDRIHIRIQKKKELKIKSKFSELKLSNLSQHKT